MRASMVIALVLLAIVLAGGTFMALRAAEVSEMFTDAAQDLRGFVLAEQWEEAVRRAYERYAVVIDNYRSGRCRPKEQLSDEFIHAVAKNMDMSNRNRQRLTELKDEVKSGISEDRQQLRSMWDELTQYMDRFL